MHNKCSFLQMHNSGYLALINYKIIDNSPTCVWLSLLESGLNLNILHYRFWVS